MWSKAARLAVIVSLAPAIAAAGQRQPPLQAAAITEHTGGRLPGALTFTDSTGQRVRLGDLLGRRPTVLMLAYFTCPMLCELGQEGAADAFVQSGWRLGRDFRAVTVSIDPRDGPAAARAWRQRIAARMHVDAAGMDWHYLTGQEPSIRALADAVGFRYAFDPESKQYSHAAALFVITADGRISRYVYGINFNPKTVASALTEARDNGVGGPVQRFLLRCYHYVPALRRHGDFVLWLLRIGGLSVVTALGGGLVLLWRRDAARLRREEAGQA